MAAQLWSGHQEVAIEQKAHSPDMRFIARFQS